MGTHKLETAKKYTGIENAERRLIFAAPNRELKDRWINTIANLIGKTISPPVQKRPRAITSHTSESFEDYRVISLTH